jgi:hypothetical protein
VGVLRLVGLPEHDKAGEANTVIKAENKLKMLGVIFAPKMQKI